MTTQNKDRIECAIRHIQTAVDVDPWAVEIAVEAMKTQLSAEGTTSDLISRQEAIDAECEVCQIAPKKERGHNCTYYVHGCKEIECLRALPSAQPEIIRCKDCKYYKQSEWLLPHMCCHYVIDSTVIRKSDDFCSRAERRTDEGD